MCACVYVHVMCVHVCACACACDVCECVYVHVCMRNIHDSTSCGLKGEKNICFYPTSVLSNKT